MNEEATQNIRRTDSGYRFELSGLRTAVADAMILIGQSSSMDHYNSNINAAVSCVDALEDHLAPYWDAEFINDRDGKVVKGTKQRDGKGFDENRVQSIDDFKKDNPKIDPDKVTRSYDEMRLDILRKQLREKIQALIRLQDRKNLLLEEETEDRAG